MLFNEKADCVCTGNKKSDCMKKVTENVAPKPVDIE